MHILYAGLGVCAHGGDGKKSILTCEFGFISNAPIHNTIQTRPVFVFFLLYISLSYKCNKSPTSWLLVKCQSAAKGSL